jgi:ParB-like chromosome segregation protein Spo0J
MIDLAGIAIFPEPMRALHPEVVADLAQSIKEIGLLNPITIIRQDGIGYRLLAGRHRYEAVKKLDRP